MTPPDTLAATLTRHEDFIRRTVRGMLRDENEVQDVVQETWLRAMARKGGNAVSAPWLARTAKNVAISRWRATKSRARRELRREDSKGTSSMAESADAPLQRFEERARIVRAILALENPYRDIVISRYESESSVRAIAESRGTTESTVRSQLSRAHALLRSRLDAEFGERRQWAVLATPLFGGQIERSMAGTTFVGGAGWGLAACTVVVTGVGMFAWGTHGAGTTAGGANAMPELAEISNVARISGGATSPPRALVATGQETGRAPAVEPSTAKHLQLPPVTLFDRSYYLSYELATYSFLHGTRDDPDLAVTRNDWDVQLSNSRFRVNMVTDDKSRIVDLTAISPHEIGVALDWGIESTEESVDVHEGHTYVILTKDTDSSLATVLHVTEHVPGRRCVFEWLATDGTGRTKGSLINEHFGDISLSDVLGEYRENLALDAVVDRLSEPLVRLQLRSGAIGGNPVRLKLNGEHYRVDEVVPDPLDLESAVPMHAPAVAHYRGGSVPHDKRFIVTDVTYRGAARGDTNGGGAFKFVLAGEVIVDLDSTDKPIAGNWRGETTIEPGEETETYFEISNSSVGEVVVEGRFEASDHEANAKASWGKNEGFFENISGLIAKRLAERYDPLEGGEVRLQVRAGAGGGNPNRIDLRGRTSGYVEHERNEALDFTEEVDADTPSETYFVGGAIPEGKVFIVSSVEYDAVAKGDNNGRGYVRLVVSGKKILDLPNDSSALGGLWRGRLILRPNEETRTYVEVGKSSTADVVIRGRLR